MKQISIYSGAGKFEVKFYQNNGRIALRTYKAGSSTFARLMRRIEWSSFREKSTDRWSMHTNYVPFKSAGELNGIQRMALARIVTGLEAGDVNASTRRMLRQRGYVRVQEWKEVVPEACAALVADEIAILKQRAADAGDEDAKRRARIVAMNRAIFSTELEPDVQVFYDETWRIDSPLAYFRWQHGKVTLMSPTTPITELAADLIGLEERVSTVQALFDRVRADI